MRLNLRSVEERVRPLGGRSSYDREFIFELLAAYGRSQNNITRLRNGSINVADDPQTEVAQRNIVYFKETTDDLYLTIDELSKSSTVVRFNIRFVVVTNYDELFAVDTKTGETLAVNIEDIHKHFTFFLPWAGMEKAQYVAESHADVKAAERMAKLYDELIAKNPDLRQSDKMRHSLNVFFTRLLFCYFAEDTGIFEEKLFTKSIESFSQADGSDLHEVLGEIFAALDTDKTSEKPIHFARFPYVNGRLFKVKEHEVVPTFTARARDLLIDGGRLLWDQINPDIFGSMFQAVVSEDERAELGQHYTSVPNILKTIEPLFLNNLREEFDKQYDNINGLNRLLDRIAKIKIFDPACGSGNFLVIAYKELRTLEHAILERQSELRSHHHQAILLGSRVEIDHFYGIEIDDFAVEVAVLSLWIAKHQMNLSFKDRFGIDLPLIPLSSSGVVRHGNAITCEWKDVCPNNGIDEIYVISNPPYLGSRNQSPEQKRELKSVTPKYKSLDYVSAWFIKGSDYIQGSNAQIAFVSTNSVTQGEQVGILWPRILDLGLEIGYAYTSFKWSNQARNSAGVTCVVVGIRNPNDKPKIIYGLESSRRVDRINAYLTDGPDIWLRRRSNPVSSQMPKLGFGSMPNDGGNLLMNSLQVEHLLNTDPRSSAYIRYYCGSDEFINGKNRWCLFIPDEELETAMQIGEIHRRIDRVVEHRIQSTEPSTRKMAAYPNRFYYSAHEPGPSLIVPSTTSERREYVPIGYLDDKTVISNSANAAYNAEPWVFALLTSRMHMAWTRAVAGQLETRIRYSATIVYNNFPVPDLSQATKTDLTEAAFRILDVREYHSEKTLAELYDPDKMPDELLMAHQELDSLVEGIYQTKGFGSDEERLSVLFALYKVMTAKGTLA